MRNELRPTARYLRGLRGYLRRPLDPADAPGLVERQLAGREDAFLRLLDRGVFRQSQGVYARLLRHGGVEHGDLESLVREHGVEGAMERLRREGIYVSLEEFKGRRPIARPGLEIPTAEADFDNPLLAGHYEARTSGSRSAGRRIVIDLDLLAYEAAYHQLFLTIHGLSGRPLAAWYATPPGAAGLKCVLYEAKLGRSAERWFTPVPPAFGPGSTKFRLFTASTRLATQLWGRPIPKPMHVPPDDPEAAVRWLAEKRAGGTPAVVSANPSSAVRAAGAAAELGLDISGTTFLIGGEPVTSAKAERVAASGSRVVPVYAMAELGLIGIGCPDSRSVDEVHLFSDKLAVIQSDQPVEGGPSVGALLLTALLPSSPKLMLNVESGDYGRLESRPCECAFGKIGLTTRLRDIRSYEKLTSEGITFLGSDLITLVEETLPARFGGGPTDYQLVEEERAGLPKVSIVVSPRIGGLDEPEVVRTVLATLGADDGRRQMSQMWKKGRTVEVVRREPYPGPMHKIQSLHQEKWS